MTHAGIEPAAKRYPMGRTTQNEIRYSTLYRPNARTQPPRAPQYRQSLTRPDRQPQGVPFPFPGGLCRTFRSRPFRVPYLKDKGYGHSGITQAKFRNFMEGHDIEPSTAMQGVRKGTPTECDGEASWEPRRTHEGRAISTDRSKQRVRVSRPCPYGRSESPLACGTAPHTGLQCG